MKEFFAKAKKWFKSKTINFGLILAIMSAVQVYYESVGHPLMTLLASCVVVYLRTVTTKPLEEK